MFFNSLHFGIFLPLVFFLYWLLSKRAIKFQNILLLIASYFFYACWDWRFLFLLAFSTALDFYSGIKISESTNQKTRNNWLWLSISINLGVLGFFKYYNFFVLSFANAISFYGFHVNTWTLNVLLPVGISFYTFHGLSYIIDIYKNRIYPEKNIINYSVFVSFFPLLVAGPIERATHLLPQIKKRRFFNYTMAADGLRQILWGLFKKVVIADQCAEYSNLMFSNPALHSGSNLILGALFFSFQIYGDFSGYSDIALGTAKLFGIELIRNFAFPYFSRDMAEFWRRWHISLSTWFKDYLYIPLGGSKGGTWLKVRNTLIIFTVSGFWHGANWTFIAWGLLNALYILPSIIFNSNRTHLDIVAKGRYLPTIREFISILATFCLTTFAWIFFRCESLSEAFYYISRFTKFSPFTSSSLPPLLPILLVIFICIEWVGREEQHALEGFGFKWPKALRWTFYYSIGLCIVNFANSGQPFIYFQF